MNQHRPGEMVSRSGVYQAHHHGHIPENEEVTILKGSTFPACLRCGENVVFQPLHIARELKLCRVSIIKRGVLSLSAASRLSLEQICGVAGFAIDIVPLQ